MPATKDSRAPATVRRLRDQLEASPRREHFYVTLLGLSTFDTLKLHDRLEEGLSYEALERLRKALDLSTAQFATYIRIPPRTLARRKDAKKLQPEESDRLLRLARILGLSLQLFEGDLEEARAWLLKSNAALDGSPPLEFATSEVGAREVEHLIGRLEHGIPL